MNEKEKYFIDLSKLSEEQRKSLPQILEKAGQEVYFLAKHTLLSGKLDIYYPYLVFSRPSSNVWVFSHNKPDRTELLYPDFIKLFEGGEGEKKTDNVLKITDRQITHLREEISRVQRQIHLIKEGKTQSGEKDRMDIVVDCCKEIDRVLCEL